MVSTDGSLSGRGQRIHHAPQLSLPASLPASLLAALRAPLLAFALGACTSDGPAAPEPEPWSATLLLGGDISALTRIEQGGGVFRDGDRVSDAIATMRAHGSNLFRLRLFVAPNGDEVQVNDLAYTIALARRVRSSGAALLLDIHYSDTWADPAQQVTPAAWQALDFAALEARVEEYTADVLAQLKAAGVVPRIVQIGNEIDGGLLWPLGRMGWAGYDAPENFERFGRLLKAGVRGVRSTTVPADSVRIMLHLSQGASPDGTRWFFDHVAAQGVPYDLIGLSYYPWWHGGIDALRANLSATALRYGKEIIVVETAYPWRAGWSLPGSDLSAMTWPITPTGQAAFVRDVISAVAATPNGLGAGVVWWYPEAINVPGLFVWGSGALAWFDYTGRVLPAAKVFNEPAR